MRAPQAFAEDRQSVVNGLVRSTARYLLRLVFLYVTAVNRLDGTVRCRCFGPRLFSRTIARIDNANTLIFRRVYLELWSGRQHFNAVLARGRRARGLFDAAALGLLFFQKAGLEQSGN
jgi:hypothetical protein